MPSTGIVSRSSSLTQAKLCKGSLVAQSKINPADEERTTDIATSGTRVHRSLANYFTEYQNLCPAAQVFDDDRRNELFDRERKRLKLTLREAWIMRDFVRKVETIISDHGGLTRITPEEPLQLLKRSTEDVILTGTTDLTIDCMDGTHHVVDYKTGYKQQDFAHIHLQLHSYMVMRWYTIKRLSKIDTIFGHLLQIATDDETKHTITIADREAISLKRKEILRIIRDASRPDGKRTIGPTQCRYCSARGTEHCPESQTLVIDLPAETRKRLTPSRMSRIVVACIIARPIIDKTLTQARAILEDDPDAIPDVELGKAAKVKSITDVNEAFVRLKNIGVTKDEFMESLSMSIETIIRSVYEAHKDSESKMTLMTARTIVEETLGDVIEAKMRKPSVKIKTNTGEEDDGATE